MKNNKKKSNEVRSSDNESSQYQAQEGRQAKAAAIDSSKRDLLKGAGAISALLVSSPARQISAQEINSKNTIPTREALEVLTTEESMVLEALCDRLIPSDENGPGALEARAAHYIDRTLASHNKADRNHYLLSLSAINRYSIETYQKEFSSLSTNEQDAVISNLQSGEVSGCSPSSTAFFNIVRNHTIDGTFCDPYYGGNQDFVGWDMLRYPGVRLGASDQDVRMGSTLAPTHQSAYDNDSYTHQPAIQRGKHDD